MECYPSPEASVETPPAQAFGVTLVAIFVDFLISAIVAIIVSIRFSCLPVSNGISIFPKVTHTQRF